MRKVDFRETRFTRIPNNVLKEFGGKLNSTDLIVYLFIAMKVDNRTKSVTISSQKIADEMGLSRRTITNSITRLVDAQYIHAERRYRSDGGRDTSRYTLLTI